jgi:hypothetical protein
LRDWEEQEIWLQVWRAFLGELNERKVLQTVFSGRLPPQTKFQTARKYRIRVTSVTSAYRFFRPFGGHPDFGKDKHILLGAYRPDRLSTPEDWALVLVAGK